MFSSKLFKSSINSLSRNPKVNVTKRFNSTTPSLEEQVAALQKRVETLERSYKSQSESFEDFTKWMKNKSSQKASRDRRFISFLGLVIILCPAFAYVTYKAYEEFELIRKRQIKDKPYLFL